MHISFNTSATLVKYINRFHIRFKEKEVDIEWHMKEGYTL